MSRWLNPPLSIHISIGELAVWTQLEPLHRPSHANEGNSIKLDQYVDAIIHLYDTREREINKQAK